MRTIGSIVLTSLLTASLTLSSTQNRNSKPAVQLQSEESQQVDQFLKRWEDERLRDLFSGAAWTLIHDYSDRRGVDQALRIMQSYFEALDKWEKGDRSSLDRFGGVNRFKDEMSALLNDDEQAVRAFAATILGIAGDRRYAKDIAKLLKRKPQRRGDQRYDRGRATLALGLLEAREYTPTLVALLRSANLYDRIGAAEGLAWMGAKQHAKAVARLLNDKDEYVRNAAMQSLEMMGATEFTRGRK